jgi:hypothetical protein
MTWSACSGGQERGGGEPGARRWFLAEMDGGWALYDRRTGELVAGPWADDGEVPHTLASALAASEAMIAAREPAMP